MSTKQPPSAVDAVQPPKVRHQQHPAKRNAIERKFRPRFWDQLDGRLAVRKEIKRRYQEIAQDADVDTAMKDLLVQRIVFTSILLESQEIEALDEGRIQIGSYVQMVNALSGLLSKIGLERKVKDLGVEQYLREKGME